MKVNVQAQKDILTKAFNLLQVKKYNKEVELELFFNGYTDVNPYWFGPMGQDGVTNILILQGDPLEANKYLSLHTELKSALCAVVKVGPINQYWFYTNSLFSGPADINHALTGMANYQYIGIPLHYSENGYLIPGANDGEEIAYFSMPFRLPSGILNVKPLQEAGKYTTILHNIERQWPIRDAFKPAIRALRASYELHEYFPHKLTTDKLRTHYRRYTSETGHVLHWTPIGTVIHDTKDNRYYDAFTFWAHNSQIPFVYALSRVQEQSGLRHVKISELEWDDYSLRWWLKHDLKLKLPVTFVQKTATTYYVIKSMNITIEDFVSPKRLWKRLLVANRIPELMPGEQDLRRALEMAARG